MLTTTRVDVRRTTGSGDPYETASSMLVLRGLAAHISAPSGAERNVGGAGERVDAIGLLPGRADIHRADIVTDQATGRTYRVGSTIVRTGLGLDHVRVALVAVAGGASG